MYLYCLEHRKMSDESARESYAPGKQDEPMFIPSYLRTGFPGPHQQGDRVSAIPVFFDPCVNAGPQTFPRGAAPPPDVVARWCSLGVPLDLRGFRPVSSQELSLAHDPGLIREVLDGRLGNEIENAPNALASALLYTSGAMLAAAREALANGAVAAAPVAGFHQAGYDYCGGDRAFNGLIVAAQVLFHGGEVGKVGIIDFDQEHGNGTDDCIRRLRLESQVRHITRGPRYRAPEQANAFLARIPSFLEALRDCDVVLYQAGADPHVNDARGGWLTNEQLAYRDHVVFDAARALGLPIAWNLAGGCQNSIETILSVHDETMIACVNVFLAR